MTRFASLILAAALAAPAALADSHSSSHAGIEILPGWRQDDGTHMAALRIILEDGWKTYWRAPGEAGIPPVFDWSASENLAGVTLHWPVPDVFASNGMTTLGYHHELVLPIEIEPADPSLDVALDGALALGICHDICMPMQVDVSAVLPQAADVPDQRIEFALLRRPETEQEAGLVSARCAVEEIADGLQVSATFELPSTGAGEVIVFEPADPAIWVSEAESRRDGAMLTAVADLVPPTAQPFELDTQTLRFTVLSETRAVDIRGCDRLP